MADHLLQRDLICLICNRQLCHRLHVIPCKQFLAWDLLTVQILVLRDTMYVISNIRRQSMIYFYGQYKYMATSPVRNSPSWIHNVIMGHISNPEGSVKIGLRYRHHWPIKFDDMEKKINSFQIFFQNKAVSSNLSDEMKPLVPELGLFKVLLNHKCPWYNGYSSWKSDQETQDSKYQNFILSDSSN